MTKDEQTLLKDKKRDAHIIRRDLILGAVVFTVMIGESWKVGRLVGKGINRFILHKD